MISRKVADLKYQQHNTQWRNVSMLVPDTALVLKYQRHNTQRWNVSMLVPDTALVLTVCRNTRGACGSWRRKFCFRSRGKGVCGGGCSK
jgi:hypothetical protein